MAPYTPAWAAGVTELPVEAIVGVARELGRHRPRAVIVPGRHVVWYGNDTQRMRAVMLLNVLLGAYGRRGGLWLGQAPFVEDYPLPPFPIAADTGG